MSKDVCVLHVAFCLALALARFSPYACAQGGPPFKSDDPDTPGNKNWEINTVLVGDRNLSEGFYEMPNIDLNYGLGNTIQLKYEIPLSIYESRDPSGNHYVAGLGNSLLGIKARFYSHHVKGAKPDQFGRREANFAVSTYPQLLLSNPKSSVRRDVVAAGPQLLIPLEANTKIGPLRLSGEYGYWFTNSNVPPSWIRGVIVGHEFSSKYEVDLEFYDQSDTKGTLVEPKIRETTLGAGFRVPVVKNRSVWFLAMAGTGVMPLTRTNGQPSWITTVGLQFLTSHRRRHSID